MLWRVISGRYYRSPIMFFTAAGGNLISDVIEVLGTRGPNDRVVAFLDDMTIYYNELIEQDLRPLYPNRELWEGWERFTQMLKEDYKVRPRPFPLPPQTAELPLTELTSGQIRRLSLTEKAAYYIYRGDVLYMERAYQRASMYFPDFFLALRGVWRDLEGIFKHYTEWAEERFLGRTATNEDRIMGKTILFSDYRFYALMPDLLAGLDPLFATEGFRTGTLDIASAMRTEAEKTRVGRAGFTLPPFSHAFGGVCRKR